MDVHPFRRALLALPLPLLLTAGMTVHGESDPFTSGPAVAVNPGEAAPGGGNVTLTVDGFTSPYVTISICGNESRRGSADCNMAASVGVEVPQDGTPLVLQIPAVAPPADCPCVVRVVGRDSIEIALAPLVITGHPVGPVVDPPVGGPLVSVSVSTREAPEGALDALRSQLGGPTTYEVTVTVRNRTTSPLKQVRLSGSAGRGSDDNIATLVLDDPGLIAVGQTWQQTVIAKVPAPSFGAVTWRVAASGAGPAVVTTKSTRHRPTLLVVLALVVVLNLGLLAIRWRVRRRVARAARRAAAHSDVIDVDGAETVGGGDATDATDAGGAVDRNDDLRASLR